MALIRDAAESRGRQAAKPRRITAVGERSRVSGKRNPRSACHPCFQAPWGRQKGICPNALQGLGFIASVRPWAALAPMGSLTYGFIA